MSYMSLFRPPTTSFSASSPTSSAVGVGSNGSWHCSPFLASD